MALESEQLVDANGESLTVEQAIANLRQTADPSLRYYAAWWIGRFRVAEPAAIAVLVEALADETDRAPDGGYPLRRNAARALGKLSNPSVVPALVACLECDDYYVREAAAQSLEMLGDVRCVPALVGLLAGGVEAAVQVEGKPHLVQPYNAVLEALGSLGGEAEVPVVEPFLDHAVPQVQNAAARAMYQLTGDATYGDRLVTMLQGPNLQLRRSALMDLGAVGYVSAVDDIAATLCENSFKLIALQQILEHHLRHTQADRLPDAELSGDARRIMALMDGLL